jgi:hypothetical protein
MIVRKIRALADLGYIPTVPLQTELLDEAVEIVAGFDLDDACPLPEWD